MASWDDVRRIALELPDTSEGTSYGNRSWQVRGKGFVWERPLSKKDRADLGAAAPDGPLLGIRVADLGVKDALLAEDGDVFLTTPHFDGYPAVLARLDVIDTGMLREVIVDAWLCRAPKRVAAAYLDEA